MQGTARVQNADGQPHRRSSRAIVTAAIRQICGYLGIALGAVGVLLCLAVIVGAWWVNEPIEHALVSGVIPSVEAALDFGETAVSEFADFVADARLRLSEAVDAQGVATALEDEMQRITTYADAAISAVASAEQFVAGLADSSANSSADSTARIAFLAARRLLTALREVNEALGAVESLIRDISDGLSDQMDALDAQLDALNRHAMEVELAIVHVEEKVAAVKGRIPLWIDLGSLAVTLVFLWFAAAQFALLRACWRLARSKAGSHGRIGRSARSSP